jgi:hypothetical protein
MKVHTSLSLFSLALFAPTFASAQANDPWGQVPGTKAPVAQAPAAPTPAAPAQAAPAAPAPTGATPPPAPPPATTPAPAAPATPAATTEATPPPLSPAATPPAAPAGGATPGAAPKPAASDEEGDDLSMTIHASRPADMQQFANESLQEIRVGQTKSRYALNLFGDLSLGAASRSEGQSVKPNPAFAVGVFDLLFTADLMSNLQAVSEVTFQYEPNAPLAELERLHIRWAPSKRFFIEMGRFHTDIGYWNVAYHHGKWLQLPIERPRTILLHGGLLPMHMVGAQAGTSIPVANGAIRLVVATGSARDPISSGSGHDSHGTAFTPIGAVQGKIESDGIGIKDLHVGVSGIYSHIPAEPAFTRPGLPDTGIEEFIGGAHIAYPSLPFSLISEGYLIQHHIKGDLASPEAGSNWRTYGAFALAGYNIGRFTPYLKGEWVYSKRNTLLPDPFYIPEPKGAHDPAQALGLLEGTAGVRIDVSTWSALKLEYRLTTGDANRKEDAAHPAIHTGTVNWSFGI